MFPSGYPVHQGSSLTALGAGSYGHQVAGPPLPADPNYIVQGSKRAVREFSVHGILGRIWHIRDLTKRSMLDADVSRGLALGITRACPRRNDACEIEALWHFAHGVQPPAFPDGRPNPNAGLPNVRYTGDLQGYDTFQSARVTLLYGGGDCDDGDILFGTLALGNQFPVKGRITVNPGGDGWAHIYPLIGFPKHNPRTWIPFDWTLGYHYFGTPPPESRHVEFDGFTVRYSPGEIRPHEYQGW